MVHGEFTFSLLISAFEGNKQGKIKVNWTDPAHLNNWTTLIYSD